MSAGLLRNFVRLLTVFLFMANAHAADSGGTFVAGWNLSGNSTANPLDVQAVFGTAGAKVPGVTASVVAVWRWNAATRTWQLYTPILDASALAAHANRQRIEVLSTINSGEAYWVLATAPFSLPAGGTADGTHTLTGADLSRGWNMAITGASITPNDLNTALQDSFTSLPPAPGTRPAPTPAGFISLWAWDSAANNWYFYAPALDNARGTLAHFILRRGLLDFAAAGKTLGAGVGFWVNMP